jgi:upstream activation factor subunit UAF30
MPKKTSTKTAETEQVLTPVDSSVTISAAPVVEKKVRKPKAPKVEAVVSANVEASIETTNTTVAAATTESSEITDLETPVIEQSIEFLAKLQQLGVLISSLKTEYRTLEKKWSRELKTAQKQTSKRKRKAGNRAPSGFVKPTRISDELAKFLEKPTGSEMARTEVTREINTYIRSHNLQDKENGRKINPDTKLAALLKLKKTDELTYFNLQKYMSPHFAKAAAKDATAAVSA